MRNGLVDYTHTWWRTSNLFILICLCVFRILSSPMKCIALGSKTSSMLELGQLNKVAVIIEWNCWMIQTYTPFISSITKLKSTLPLYYVGVIFTKLFRKRDWATANFYQWTSCQWSRIRCNTMINNRFPVYLRKCKKCKELTHMKIKKPVKQDRNYT